MEHKFNYPAIDTLEVTAADLSLINELFAVSNILSKDPTIISGNLELAMHLGAVMTTGRNCQVFTKALRERMESHINDCKQARKDIATEAAEITTNMMIMSEVLDNPSAKKQFDAIMGVIDKMTPEQVAQAAKEFGC